MARFTPFMFVVLLTLPYLQVSAVEPATLIAITSVVSFVTTIVTFTKQASDVVKNGMRFLGENPDTDTNHYKRPFNSMHNSLMEQLRFLSKKTDLLKTNIDDLRDDVVSQVTEKVPGLVELNSRLSEIFIRSVKISKAYDDFLTYYDHPEKFDKTRVIQFANKMISEENNGITNMLEDIHARLVLMDDTTPSAVKLLSKYADLFIRNARISKSAQQLLYELYKSTIFVEVKGFLTIKYSYDLLSMYKQGNFIGHIEKAEYDFGRRLNATIDSFKSAMELASREVWRVNPVQHIEDVTYTELKHVFQKFVINEYDLNPTDQCKNECSNYRRFDLQVPHSCGYRGEICEVTYCNGDLYDCHFPIKSDLIICPSEANGTRRYEYIDHSNGLRLGDPDHKCAVDPLYTSRHFSDLWWCEPCMCTCADSSTKSERRFNLDPVYANTAENYVITGARFVKRNRMIHIQIQEGQLVPTGQINASTVHWVEINENPIYYHTLEWEQNREIHLDDMIAYKTYALTGLTFETIKTDETYAKRLKLKAFAAPIDFYNGKVYDNEQTSLYPYEFLKREPINEIKLDNVDIPTRTTVQEAAKSVPDQYVKFGTTGLDIDIGQSTIPFIDIQSVTTSPAVPMSGVGIYLKRRSENGGFLALRMYSYDYAQHLEADLPEDYKSLEFIH